MVNEVGGISSLNFQKPCRARARGGIGTEGARATRVQRGLRTGGRKPDGAGARLRRGVRGAARRSRGADAARCGASGSQPRWTGAPRRGSGTEEGGRSERAVHGAYEARARRNEGEAAVGSDDDRPDGGERNGAHRCGEEAEMGREEAGGPRGGEQRGCGRLGSRVAVPMKAASGAGADQWAWRVGPGPERAASVRFGQAGKSDAGKKQTGKA